MTKRAKMHTLELTETEIARVLFVMKSVYGEEVYGRRITSSILDKLGLEGMAFDDLHSKWEELAKVANIPKAIYYYVVQKEWESFLGIGGMDQVTLDKIAKLERELAELKGLV